MGEVNGSLRTLLIQSRTGLPSMAREMMSRGIISEEALARLQEITNGQSHAKVRVI